MLNEEEWLLHFPIIQIAVVQSQHLQAKQFILMKLTGHFLLSQEQDIHLMAGLQRQVAEIKFYQQPQLQ